MANSKHISEDEIKYTIGVEASDAQKQIYELEKETKEYSKANKNLSEQMVRLEAAGKKNTKEYKNLKQSYKDNSKAIQENREKIQGLISKLDKTALSSAQLSKEIKRVKKELANTVKALEPERYRQLSRELEQLEKAYRLKWFCYL